MVEELLDNINKQSSDVPTIEWFPEIKVEELINKYGPEGLYDIAHLLMNAADKDVSDTINSYENN